MSAYPVQLDALKESSVTPDQSLLNKLIQVKDPANLKQLLVEQSNSLFKHLFIKQRELDKVKNKMLTEIHDGGGASTSFKELSGLIEGLKQLISSRATSFGVTPQDLYSHKQVWEKRNTNTKTSVVGSSLARPDKPGPVIMVECAVQGLRHLPFYDIEVLYKLMKWSQGSKSTIPPSWLKDSVLVFQVSKDTEKNVKEIVSYCSESGWASSYTEQYTGGMIAFVWKSLSEAFLKKDQLNDDDDDDDEDEDNDNDTPSNRTTPEKESESSDDESSDGAPMAQEVASSHDESNHAVSQSEVVDDKKLDVRSSSSDSDDDDESSEEENSVPDSNTDIHLDTENDGKDEENSGVSITKTSRKRPRLSVIKGKNNPSTKLTVARDSPLRKSSRKKKLD